MTDKKEEIETLMFEIDTTVELEVAGEANRTRLDERVLRLLKQPEAPEKIEALYKKQGTDGRDILVAAVQRVLKKHRVEDELQNRMRPIVEQCLNELNR